MPRTARRFTAALLWLAIALVPMRGLAGVLMPMVMMQASAATVTTAEPSHAVAAPCHGVAAESHDAGAVPSGAGAICTTCAICDLCHGSVLQSVDALPPWSAPHEPMPAAQAPMPIEPRTPDGLFRPPRPQLA